MSEKERLKDQPDAEQERRAAERPKPAEPHPGRSVLGRYLEGTLDPEDAAHLRVHLFACRECYETLSLARDLDERLDLADPRGDELQAVEFAVSALPALRKGAGSARWWQDPKRSAAGPWLVQGPYRLALGRASRDELAVCLRDRDRPLRGALAVLEPAGKRGTPELARAVTNERGEATLRFGVMPPATKGDYRLRVLVVER
jgi:hypothetical protein